MIGDILQWGLVGIGAIGLTAFIIGRINKYIDGLFAKFRIFTNKVIVSLCKDEEMRSMAYAAILYAQKTFADLSGDGRLQKAIEYVQKKIPGKFDDEIVKKVIENIYEEIMKPIKEEE